MMQEIWRMEGLSLVTVPLQSAGAINVPWQPLTSVGRIEASRKSGATLPDGAAPPACLLQRKLFQPLHHGRRKRDPMVGKRVIRIHFHCDDSFVSSRA